MEDIHSTTYLAKGCNKKDVIKIKWRLMDLNKQGRDSRESGTDIKITYLDPLSLAVSIFALNSLHT